LLLNYHLKYILYIKANVVSICLSVCASVCEVLKPRSLFKLSPWTRGPKNYSRPQSHTFTSLLTESWVLNLESRPMQVPSPNTHASNYLLGCLRSKSRTVKKNLAQARRRLGVWNRENKYLTGAVTKPGLPTKTRVPGHKPSSLPWMDRNRPVCFQGLSSTLARVPELGCLSPFSL